MSRSCDQNVRTADDSLAMSHDCRKVSYAVLCNVTTLLCDQKRCHLRCIATQGRSTSRQTFGDLITTPIMHQPTNSTIRQRVFRQSMSIYQCFGYSCTAHAQKLPFTRFKKKFLHRCQIRFSDLDFLTENNNFAIRRRYCVHSHCTDRKMCKISVSGLSDLMTLNMSHVTLG